MLKSELDRRQSLIASFELHGWRPYSKLSGEAYTPMLTATILMNEQGHILIIVKKAAFFNTKVASRADRREPRPWSALTLSKLEVMHERLLKRLTAESQREKEAARVAA